MQQYLGLGLHQTLLILVKSSFLEAVQTVFKRHWNLNFEKYFIFVALMSFIPIFTLTGYPFRFQIYQSDTAVDVITRMIRECDYVHKEMEKFETLDSFRLLETTYRTDGSYYASRLIPNDHVFEDIPNLYLSDNLERPGRRNRLQLVCTNHKFNVRFDLKTCMFLGISNVNKESIDFYGYPGITAKNLVCMIRNMLGLSDDRFSLYVQKESSLVLTIPECELCL